MFIMEPKKQISQDLLIQRKKRLLIAKKGLITKGKSTKKVDEHISDVILQLYYNWKAEEANNTIKTR